MLFYSIPYFWRKVCTKIRAEQRGFLSICKCAAAGAYLRDSPLFPHFPNARRRRGGCIFSMWKTIPPPTDNFRHLWVSFALYHYISGADAVDIPPQLSTACGKPGWKNCIRTVSHCIFSANIGFSTAVFNSLWISRADFAPFFHDAGQRRCRFVSPTMGFAVSIDFFAIARYNSSGMRSICLKSVVRLRKNTAKLQLSLEKHQKQKSKFHNILRRRTPI